MIDVDGQRAAIKALVAAAPHRKRIGPEMILYARSNGGVLTWISDKLVESLPGWCVQARPSVVHNDPIMRNFWDKPVDRMLIVAIHEYLCKWLYAPMYEKHMGEHRFGSLDAYCKHMLEKAENDFQDSAPRWYALYRWEKVIAPQPLEC